jgi:hypothetical protein
VVNADSTTLIGLAVWDIALRMVIVILRMRVTLMQIALAGFVWSFVVTSLSGIFVRPLQIICVIPHRLRQRCCLRSEDEGEVSRWFLDTVNYLMTSR